jgi:hypothetical protein
LTTERSLSPHRLGCALFVGSLCGGTSAGLAQVPPDAAARDSVLQCAVRRAETAGFHLLPNQRPGRLGLMRSIQTPGPRQPVDGMRLAVAPGDSAGTLRLEVSVTTFLVTRSGFSSAEVAPRPSLVALADSLRVTCRRTRAQTQPRESS